MTSFFLLLLKKVPRSGSLPYALEYICGGLIWWNKQGIVVDELYKNYLWVIEFAWEVVVVENTF